MLVDVGCFSLFLIEQWPFEAVTTHPIQVSTWKLMFKKYKHKLSVVIKVQLFFLVLLDFTFSKCNESHLKILVLIYNLTMGSYNKNTAFSSEIEVVLCDVP